MKRPRFFTPAEVASHFTAGDLWVSFLGKVCDLTPLMKQHSGDVLLLPIMECAGKDISSWFDPKTRDVSFILSSPFTLIPSVKPAEVVVWLPSWMYFSSDL
uniref:Cytochrome b5 domain-containing protein 1 n=1 Tax=Xiphophorus couchianus TaxID=32473 RepID=A0A3B5M7Y4_9TELE